MTPSVSLLAVAFALAVAPATGRAGPAQPPTLEWDLRLRREVVDDDAFAPLAEATTARLRTGLRFAPAPGWSGLLEAEAIAAGGPYNSGANGRVAYPQVIDPPGVSLNQAWLAWKAARGGMVLGRQRLQFDNQRWLGNVGWRQDEQTFDALAIDLAPRKALALRYAYLGRVHRVAGDDARDPLARERAVSTHLLNAAWKSRTQQWAGYAYLHEDRDVPAASSTTLGVRWAGTHAVGGTTLGWTAEAARQRDHAGNPLRFSHAYVLLEPSIVWHGITARAGFERLGGDGSHALQTPLATLHAFDGWADKFLVTPPDGLEDRYLALGGAAGRERGGGRPAWQVVWHDYRADHGSTRYGREWDASLAVPLRKDVSVLLKVADYRADRFARDTRKLWLQVEYKGQRRL